jgi:hypothetical protein
MCRRATQQRPAANEAERVRVDRDDDVALEPDLTGDDRLDLIPQYRGACQECLGVVEHRIGLVAASGEDEHVTYFAGVEVVLLEARQVGGDSSGNAGLA